MKVITSKEAEKLICPFMSNAVASATDAGDYPVECVSSNCIAWVKEYPMNEENSEGYCSKIGKTQ